MKPKVGVSWRSMSVAGGGVKRGQGHALVLVVWRGGNTHKDV